MTLYVRQQEMLCPRHSGNGNTCVKQDRQQSICQKLARRSRRHQHQSSREEHVHVLTEGHQLNTQPSSATNIPAPGPSAVIVCNRLRPMKSSMRATEREFRLTRRLPYFQNVARIAVQEHSGGIQLRAESARQLVKGRVTTEAVMTSTENVSCRAQHGEWRYCDGS
jgi:hypothetical protein